MTAAGVQSLRVDSAGTRVGYAPTDGIQDLRIQDLFSAALVAPGVAGGPPPDGS